MKKLLTSILALAALATCFISCDTAVENDPEEFAKANLVENSMFIEGFVVNGLNANYDGKTITLSKQTVVKTTKETRYADAVKLADGIIADSSKLYKSGKAYSLIYTKDKDGKYTDTNAMPNYTYEDFEVPQAIKDAITAANEADAERKEDVASVEVRFNIVIGDVDAPDASIFVVKTANDGSQNFEGAQLDIVTSKAGTKTADLAKMWLNVTVPSVEADEIVGTFAFEKPAKIEEPVGLFYIQGGFGKDREAMKLDIANKEMTFDWTYSGSDGWGGKAGQTVFAILLAPSDAWDTREKVLWNAEIKADGTWVNADTTDIKSKYGVSDPNVFVLGLTKDKKYKLTIDFTNYPSPCRAKVTEVTE